MDPFDARIYTAYKIKNRFKNDFEEYWGSLKKYQTENFKNNNWKWKTEFHYLDMVPLNKIEAIIWPIETFVTPGDIIVEDSKMKSNISKFKKNNPEIMVYPYHWVQDEAPDRFVYASTIVSFHFKDTGEYPDAILFKSLFKNKFYDSE